MTRQLSACISMAAILWIAGTCGCASTRQGVRTGLRPTSDQSGAQGTIEVDFTSPSEIPGKLLRGVGDALVCVTQPIHPYHYIRNEDEDIIRDKNGDTVKVWLPFWRIIGKHHGDSAIGIVYDHGWFAGWNDRPGDKLGKLAGLALLAWGADGAFSGSNDAHERPQSYEAPVASAVSSSRADRNENAMSPLPEVPPPPVDPPPIVNPDPDDMGWDLGIGAPVGGPTGL